MGDVYLADHELLRVHRALKVLPEKLAGSAGFQSRFLSEAQVLARLQHPHIVAVHDMVVEESVHAIAMDFVSPDGRHSQSLEDLRRDRGGHLPAPETARILVQVCSAIAYAHGCGVIHRDIKAGNALVGADGGVKVSDFGLAAIVGDEFLRESIAASMDGRSIGLGATFVPGSSPSAPGPAAADSIGSDATLGSDDASRGSSSAAASIVGTFQYMPPEVQQGGGWSERGDIYSIGVLAYVLLTGTLPMGRWRTPAETVDGLAAAWDEVVVRALSARMEDRQASAGELLEELHVLAGMHGAGGAVSNVAPASGAGRLREAQERAETLKIRHESSLRLRSSLLERMASNDDRGLRLAVETALELEPAGLFDVVREIVNEGLSRHALDAGWEKAGRIIRFIPRDHPELAKLRSDMDDRVRGKLDRLSAVFSAAVSGGGLDQAAAALDEMRSLGVKDSRLDRFAGILEGHRREAEVKRLRAELAALLVDGAAREQLEHAGQLLERLKVLEPDDAGVRQDAGRWEALNRAAVCEQLKTEVTLKLDAGDITSAEALLARMEKTGPREPSTKSAREHIAEWKRSAIDAKRGLLASLLTSAPSGD
ncbi:MAG: serine/threonine-protein kinase, partial [Candidatus Sumerlaeota bacterium]|nr:serine/threonine-protein kinase [Candidatus Sumerlaeota bacterium]